MENKLFEELDGLNIKYTTLLLDKDINLSVDYFTKKRIEKSINKKIGYYNTSNMLVQKINDILGGIFMKKKIALALTVGVILSSAGGGYVYAQAKTNPVAYVSMDINPSVELGVNAFDEVVSAEAYNEDGEKVLEGTNLVNSNIDDAVSTVISNAVSDGYIKEDGLSAIEITTATDKEDVATELGKSLKETADKALEDNKAVAEVETKNVALARRDEARKLGITPGKLNLIQKLQALDPTITVEDYKDSSVKDIQNKTKELRKDNNSNEITTEDITNTTDTSADVVATDENVGNTSNDNGNSKKEEHSNSNSIKEESNGAKDKEKDTITTPAKPNNSNNLNLQNNNNNSDIQNKSSNKEKSKNN